MTPSLRHESVRSLSLMAREAPPRCQGEQMLCVPGEVSFLYVGVFSPLCYRYCVL